MVAVAVAVARCCYTATAIPRIVETIGTDTKSYSTFQTVIGRRFFLLQFLRELLKLFWNEANRWWMDGGVPAARGECCAGCAWSLPLAPTDCTVRMT